MTPEEINKIIGDYCGSYLNFHSSLDAMHIAEKSLTLIQYECYELHLRPIGTNLSRLTLATASQKANAFVKAIKS